MAAIYIRGIQAGRMTIEDVPARWRELVREKLNGEGGTGA